MHDQLNEQKKIPFYKTIAMGLTNKNLNDGFSI